MVSESGECHALSLRKKFHFKNPILRIGSAVFLLILGVLGCILPLAPGIPFLLAALYLFYPKWFKERARWVKRKLKSMRKR